MLTILTFYCMLVTRNLKIDLTVADKDLLTGFCLNSLVRQGVPLLTLIRLPSLVISFEPPVRFLCIQSLKHNTGLLRQKVVKTHEDSGYHGYIYYTDFKLQIT